MLIGSSNCSDCSRRASSVSETDLARRQKCLPFFIEGQGAFQFRTTRPGGFQHGPINQLTKAAGVKEEADAGLAQGVFQLGGLIRRVDVDENGADPRRGVLDDDPLPAVRRPDAHAVARRDAESEQRPRGLRHDFPQLAVGGAVILPADHQSVAVAVAFGRGAEVVADGLTQQRRCANAVRIGKCGH